MTKEYSDKYLEQILDSLPEPIYWLDKKGRYLGCNKLIEQLFNISKEEIIGKTNQELLIKNKSENITEETVKAWDRINQEVMTSGEPRMIEEPGPYFKQKPTIYLSNKIPLKDKQGNTVGVLGISINITQEKDIKKLKKEAEAYMISTEHYENIIDKLPELIYWYDREGRYLGCNKELLKVYEIEDKRDLIGKTNYELSKKYKGTAPLFPLAKVEEMNEKIMSSGRSRTFQDTVDRNGVKKTYLSNKTPLKDKSGETIGMLGVTVDITEHKKMQELKSAKDQLNMANKVKNDFLANMSHEMRTPLNIIYGQMQLLLREENTTGKRKAYQAVLNNCHTMMHLIDDIMDVAKLEGNNLKLKKNNFDLFKLINELYLEYHNQKPTVKLNLNLPKKESLLIQTDRVRLKQVLTNLLTNAYKATSEGAITIEVLIKNQQLHFSVQDTGRGIKDCDQDKIFQRFTKIHHSLPGTGIGLTIVQSLLELLGGKISFQSEENKGSTFYFHIPLVQGESPKKNDKEISNINWNNKTILLVEDISGNAAILEQFLQQKNAKIMWAKDGLSAVDIFHKSFTQIDLVLLDIGLPDIDGFEVLKRIRKIKENVPIVAQTAHAKSNERDVFTSLGFDEFILKPIQLNLLEKIINEQIC